MHNSPRCGAAVRDLSPVGGGADVARVVHVELVGVRCSIIAGDCAEWFNGCACVPGGYEGVVECFVLLREEVIRLRGPREWNLVVRLLIVVAVVRRARARSGRV